MAVSKQLLTIMELKLGSSDLQIDALPIEL